MSIYAAGAAETSGMNAIETNRLNNQNQSGQDTVDVQGLLEDTTRLMLELVQGRSQSEENYAQSQNQEDLIAQINDNLNELAERGAIKSQSGIDNLSEILEEFINASISDDPGQTPAVDAGKISAWQASIVSATVVVETAEGAENEADETSVDSFLSRLGDVLAGKSPIFAALTTDAKYAMLAKLDEMIAQMWEDINALHQKNIAEEQELSQYIAAQVEEGKLDEKAIQTVKDLLGEPTVELVAELMLAVVPQEASSDTTFLSQLVSRVNQESNIEDDAISFA